MKTNIMALLLAGTTPFIYAQTTPSPPTTLPDVLVTATRSKAVANELAAGTAVYTRADIEHLQAQTLPDLLRITTSIDMTQQGGDGKITSVFMRGTNSDHVLVLIDGIKVGSVTSGTSPFEFIPIDQVEKIEIVKGPNSSLYGSEAIGGVIQIFTRKGANTETPKVSLDAGGGNYSSLKSSGTVSGKWQNSWYSFGASHYNTEGFNSCQKNGACFVDEPDNDGYYNTAVHARVGHHFDKVDIEGSFMRSQGRTEYDGSFQNKTKFINQVAALSASVYLSDNWQSSLSLGQSLDYNDNFSPQGALSTTYNSQRWNATWLNQHQLTNQHQVVWGTDFRLDEVDSTDQFSQKSRYDIGVFGEVHSQVFNNHFINASLRYDNNEAFGDYVTGNFGWRYNSPIGVSPFASFGNAFKAPNFNSLYYPKLTSPFQGVNYIYQGNPHLRPEQSTSFEVGVAGDHKYVDWELRAYHTDITDLIADRGRFVNPTTSLTMPENVNKAQIDGLEATISTQLLGWNMKLNGNLLAPYDRISDQRLIRRAKKTLTFDLSRSFGQFDVAASVLAQGNRPDIDFQTNTIAKVAGFVTVDLRAAYHFDKHWQVSAKLNNLLDKQYQLLNTYNTADRSFFINLHYNN